MKKHKVDVGGHDIVPYLASLAEYMHESGIPLKPYPKVKFDNDEENAKKPFGRTGFYEPDLCEVTLYTEGRHIKDVLRSAAHEFVHHSQRLAGKLGESATKNLDDPNYAQNNSDLRKLEGEAYFKGNMAFRDWEDKIKASK